MKEPIIFFALLACISCQKGEIQLDQDCEVKTEILVPAGYEMETIGEISWNGSMKDFQFLDAQNGYALGSSNMGGYAEVFKTTDGGHSWSDLDVAFHQIPKGMVFKNTNLGIVTVYDKNRCVLWKTSNGGLDWQSIEIDGLTGTFHHPQYDSQGNLYATLYDDGRPTLMKSTDDGSNWDTLFSSPDMDYALVTFSFKILNDKIFVTGKNGSLLLLDTSVTFIRTIHTSQNRWIWDVEIVDENNFVVVYSQKTVKTQDGGMTWQSIYQDKARMIGFESADKGLMFLRKSSCPTDVVQMNEVISSTADGGLSWTEASATSTNLSLRFAKSRKMGTNTWYCLFDKKLIEFRER